MLTEICAEIKNYFSYECDRHIGDFAIIDGHVTPSFDIPTDYIRVVGSHLNDGVHKISDNDLVDEGKFHGAIWVMSPPKDFLALADEIASWQEANGAVNSTNMSPFQSESFGGYSYSKGMSYSNSQGNASPSGSATWQSQYASRLKIYRRIRVL